jgi:hypothetical protein
MTQHTDPFPYDTPPARRVFDYAATPTSTGDIYAGDIYADAGDEVRPETTDGVNGQAGLLLVAFLNGVTVGLVLMAAFILTKARIGLHIEVQADVCVALLLACTKQARKK